MSYSEYLAWLEYVKKRGSLNLGLRLEWLFARVSYQISRALGGKSEFEDFRRYQDEKIATISDIARMMGIKSKPEK